jgi:eukaryotic-like serine/threonine-protein kinase
MHDHGVLAGLETGELLPRTGTEGDQPELIDTVELVLGDLPTVEFQDPGVSVLQVDFDVVDQAGELAALRADRLDRRRKLREAATGAGVGVVQQRGAERQREEHGDHHDGDTSRVLEHTRAFRDGHAPRVTLGGATFRVVGAGTLDRMAISGVADLTGRVLAGRYRLLTPIGAGASGRVYVADDVRLRRRVAVKVLHAALADDAGFLRRFRAEAQVAASLHQPNVMAVYDWGDDDVPFMVLELLRGGSLRGLLDTGEHLTPAQAIHVGRQVTAALEYAHVRGIVHRDIKPANLLFDEHGILRVADFGLARALAEASWTEPAGSVVGTARYAAPEQASGAPLDGRADLYALAIVLVESVTGTVPAMADTAIGTLAARQHTPLLAPSELGRLGPVVERAGRPDPAERYPDAATMGAALADAERAFPRAQPLVLPGLGADGGGVVDPTQIGGVSTRLFDQDASADDADEPVPLAPRRERTPGSQRLVPLVVAFAVIAALVAGGVAIAATSGGTVAVPSVVGLSQDDAKIRVATDGFTVTIVERIADDPKGVVIAQHPAGGSFAGDGTKVRLVVSRGPPPVQIPDVRSLSPEDAKAQLEQDGFVVTTVPQNDETIPYNHVIGTDPPIGRSTPRDSEIKLLVSNGPAPVQIPDVSNMSYDDAAQALGAKGFAVTRSDDFSDTIPVDKVIGTNPASGTSQPRGSSVQIVVSKGPDLVTVPNLKGETLEMAQQQLVALGLDVDTVGYLPGRLVRDQTPAANQIVTKTTKVTLIF